MKRAVFTLGILSFLILLIHWDSEAQTLKKLSLDDTSTLGLRLQTDSRIKVQGSGSLKITTAWPTSVCLGEVTGLEIENARLIYRAEVKSDLNGTAFLEMWCHIGGSPYFSRGMDSTISGEADWKTIQTPFFLQKGQNPDRIILNIVINGTGTIWIDDVVLSKEPL